MLFSHHHIMYKVLFAKQNHTKAKDSTEKRNIAIGTDGKCDDGGRFTIPRTQVEITI